MQRPASIGSRAAAPRAGGAGYRSIGNPAASLSSR